MSGNFLQKNGSVKGNGNGNGFNGHYGWKFVDKWGVVIVIITLFSAFVFADKWLQQREDKVARRVIKEVQTDIGHNKAMMELRMDRLERKIDRISKHLYTNGDVNAR